MASATSIPTLATSVQVLKELCEQMGLKETSSKSSKMWKEKKEQNSVSMKRNSVSMKRSSVSMK